MRQHTQGKHRHSIESRLAKLKTICAELRNALAEANDYDACAEQCNKSNFKHRRKEFDSLAIHAGQILREMEKETE